MKKYLPLLFLSLTANLIVAQDIEIIDSVDIPFEQQVEDLFEHVDLSEVTNSNGILYQYGFPLFAIENFKGSLTDTNKTSMLAFSLSYATIYSMAADSAQRLAHPSVYRSICDTIKPDADVIPLVLFNQHYFQLDSTAVDSNLFTISGDQLYDVSGRPYSPYLKDSLFMVAPVHNAVKGNILSLSFKSNLNFNNSGKTIQSLAIDFDDGRGYMTVPFDSALTTAYDTAGYKHIQFKVTYSGNDIHYSHADIYVENPPQRTSDIDPYDVVDLSHYITVYDTIAGQWVGGTVHVSYACGNTGIQKPLIWAEGFNPIVGGIDLSLGYNDASVRIGLEQIGGKPMSDYLLEDGYDFIVLDYEDGADYFWQTALFIEEAIRWVNEQKQLAGSKEKNIVIGQSMGGMCARYAIRTMEMNNEDHEIETFISFDSAMQGANLPFGPQCLLNHLGNLPIAGLLPLSNFVQLIDDALTIVASPAAKTMMKYCRSGDNITFAHSLHDDFYTDLNAMGEPQNCDFLCIANGSKQGVAGGQTFGPGSLVLHANENTAPIINSLGGWTALGTANVTVGPSHLFWLLGTGVWSEIKVWAMPTYQSTKQKVYRGKIFSIVLGVPLVIANKTIKVKNKYPLDSAPGGLVYPHDISTVVPILTPNVYHLGGFCFVPTVSALNYYGTSGSGFTDLQKNLSNNSSEISLNNVRNVDNYEGNTLTGSYGTPTSFKNSQHTYFTSESAPFLLYHIVGSNMLGGITNLDNDDIYQFGKADMSSTTNYLSSDAIKTKAVQSVSLIVEDNAQLLINADGSSRIGLTPTYSCPYPKDVSFFGVHIKNDCDETAPIVLTLRDNAILEIGDGSDRIGRLTVHNVIP